jgi:predicted metalloendopeptidase
MTKTIKNKNNNVKNTTLKKKEVNIICKDFSSFEKNYEKTALGKKQARQNTEQELVKMFKTPFTKSSITPRNNFYEYVNYEWINTIERQKRDKFYVLLDVFRFAQEKVYYELINLSKKYISENNTRKSKCFSNVYESMLNLNEITLQNHLTNMIEHIDEDIKENNVWKLLATINSNEIISWSSPISWSMAPDAKHADTYINTISSGQYSLYDFSLYYDFPTDTKEDQKYKTQVRKRYLDFIDEMFDTCLGKNHGLHAKDVYDVEVELMGAYMCTDIKNESSEFYNIVHADEALEKYGFNWKEFATQLGYTDVPKKFVCTGLNYLKCACDSINTNWKTAKWRSYWIFLYAKQMMRFHKKWRKIYFEFFKKYLQGQEEMFPHDIYPVFGLSITFNTLLTDLYMEKNKNENKINYVKSMATDLKRVFERIIERNDWLSPSTKEAALKKFRYIDFVIGDPPKLREDPLLDYSADDAWGNMMKISDWKLKKYLKLDGEKVINIPAFDWKEFKMTGTQSYIVNCFYTAIENRIYIPMAYLQKPFIDLEERGIEYNLAHVGYAIGHELSHSLDNTGSQYDFRGNKVSWWTPRDRKIFNRKVANVIKQYETFASYDNITFDAAVGTGEDMADISGLAICTEYLRDFQDKNMMPTPIRAFSFHTFFTYIAIQGRQKVNKKAFAAQLKSNPHPMQQYRVNCALARIKLFVSLYNIKKGDKMYWPTMDTIW